MKMRIHAYCCSFVHFDIPRFWQTLLSPSCSCLIGSSTNVAFLRIHLNRFPFYSILGHELTCDDALQFRRLLRSQRPRRHVGRHDVSSSQHRDGGCGGQLRRRDCLRFHIFGPDVGSGDRKTAGESRVAGVFVNRSGQPGDIRGGGAGRGFIAA